MSYDKNTHVVMCEMDMTPVRDLFHTAVARRDYDAACWWDRVGVAALMLGNYNLAEDEDRAAFAAGGAT